MTFNKYTWDLYKQTNGGRRTIEQFEKSAQDVAMYELISKLLLSGKTQKSINIFPEAP